MEGFNVIQGVLRMKSSELTTEAIYEGIGKTSGELAIMTHQLGYYHLAIKIEGDDVVDYNLFELTDDYFRAENWHRIDLIGTGSIACNCDACSNGENPEDWADDEAYNYDDFLSEKIEQCILEIK